VLGVELRALDRTGVGGARPASGEGLAVTAVDPRGPASGVLEEGDCCSRSTTGASPLARLKARRRARCQRGAHATLVIQRGGDRFALPL
jgi:hypothetical protein